MNYKTYTEAKIANPYCEIVTTGKDWSGDASLIGVFEALVLDKYSDNHEDGAHEIDDKSWVICNPADHCSTLKEFLDAGFNFAIGDLFLGTDGTVHDIEAIYPQTNKLQDSDDKRYILSAAVLNGGCKIPAKTRPWTIYNNTLPLRELTDEQVGKLVKHSGCVEILNKNSGEWRATISPMWNRAGVYRIKPKSERELFIEKSMEACKENQHNKFEFILGKIYDAGARYVDLTQYFGENI